jgi:hypothetical protein
MEPTTSMRNLLAMAASVAAASLWRQLHPDAAAVRVALDLRAACMESHPPAA